MTNTEPNVYNLESVVSKDMHGQEKFNAVKFSPVIEGYSVSDCPYSIMTSKSTRTESQVSASDVTESKYSRTLSVI